jgi:hypothetical protein
VPARQWRRRFPVLSCAVAVDHVLLHGVHDLSLGRSGGSGPSIDDHRQMARDALSAPRTMEG